LLDRIPACRYVPPNGVAPFWQSRKPSKRALQLAFYGGVVTISERNGTLKTYELTTRHGTSRRSRRRHRSRPPTYLLDRALRAQGVVSLGSICHLDAPVATVD
jgi:uncharacterized protein